MTVAFLLCGGLSSAALFWVPGTVGATLRNGLGGLGGGFIAVGFCYMVFRWLVGPGAFGLSPLLATTLPMSIVLSRFYNKRREVIQIAEESPEPEKMAEVIAPYTASYVAGTLTMAIGILAGAIWFFGK